MDEQFQEALAFLGKAFADDPSSPGLLVSWLEDKKTWYVAYQRYAERFGNGRRVVAKSSGEDLGVVIQDVLLMVKSVEGL